MRLALVGWAADSGVGREMTDAARNLPAAAAFVLHNPSKPTRTDLLGGLEHQLCGANPVAGMARFLDSARPDAVLTWETPGSWHFPVMWSERGVRWFHVVHWDWLDEGQVRKMSLATLVAPNEMCRRGLRERYGLESRLLPVPVDTSRLPFRRRTEARSFVSSYGYGGPGDRRSLPEIYSAWRAMGRGAPRLILKAQRHPGAEGGHRPESVSIQVGTAPSPADLWGDADVAVQPSRYEGVGVTMLEAQACGVPVVAVDAEPMNEVAPDLRVRVARRERVDIMGRSVESSVPCPESLREVVSGLRGRDVSALSEGARGRAETLYSWRALRARWADLLGVA